MILEVGIVRNMALRRKFALLMFIAILSWTAAPAVACFSGAGMRAGHDCCAVMPTCDATMTSSCCKLAPRSDTPEMISEYSPEHEQQPGLLWHSSFPPSLTVHETSQIAIQMVPVPEPSPGSLSVLRI